MKKAKKVNKEMGNLFVKVSMSEKEFKKYTKKLKPYLLLRLIAEDNIERIKDEISRDMKIKLETTTKLNRKGLGKKDIPPTSTRKR